MEKTHLQFRLTISCLCLLWICGFAAVPSKDSLGIDPKDESYYKSNVIKCKDGSKKFSREQLNDEFCDCPDGTDEPGTSACPEGKFYCHNVGHIPLTIFSSRVNDGLCDCCDGSDEYDGTVNCANTCWEAGKAAREKMNKKIQTYKKGVIIRKQEVEMAKQAFAKDEADLSKLKSEEKILKELVDKLKEHKELIEKAEEEERIKKEREEKRLREAENKAREQEKLSEEASHDRTDRVNEESTMHKDALKEGHDAAVEAEKDQNAETELSANHAVDEHVEEEEDDDTYKSITADHSRSGEQSSSDITNQPVEEEEDDDDTYKSVTADHSRSGEQSSSDITNQNEALKEGHDAAVEAEKDHNTESELSANHAMEEYVLEEDDDTYKSVTADHSRSGEQYSSDIANQQQEGSDDTSGLSKEELGRLVASRWTGDDAGHKTDEASSTVKDEVHHDIPNSAGEEDDNGYTSETEDDRHKYDDGDFEDDSDEEYVQDHVESDGSYTPYEDDKNDFADLTGSGSSSWLDKLKQTVQNVLSSFNLFKTPVDLSDADRVLKEYDESKSKLSKLQSRISRLTEKLKHDFGVEKEFYSFYDRCFENKQNKYVYKVCPFKQASQVEGHSTTGLGQWEKFEESYRVMKFSSGDKCWNGPDRSLKVRLRCGLTNELTDVDEPSRCEYVALLSTPALCLEDKLKELEHKLEQMNTRQPQNHDEL